MTAAEYVAQARATADWFFGGFDAGDMPRAYGQTLYLNNLGHVGIAPPGHDIDVFRDVVLRAVLTPENTRGMDTLVRALLASEIKVKIDPSHVMFDEHFVAFVNDDPFGRVSASKETALQSALDAMLGTREEPHNA